MRRTEPIMPGTPHAAALRAAVEAAYALVPDRVSPGLEVCSCPVCMTDATRRAIIATPVRALSVDLIAEYTNSAHGVPDCLDDLAALLPRYLELLAQGDEVEHGGGVGVELARFGDARRVGRGFPATALARVWDDWARAMILQAGTAEAQGAEVARPTLYLTEMLICGGTPVPVVTAALDGLFADPDAGGQALRHYLAALGRAWNGRILNLHGLSRVPADDRGTLADWLNALLTGPDALDLVTGAEPPDMPHWRAEAMTAVGLGGTLDASRFPAWRGGTGAS